MRYWSRILALLLAVLLCIPLFSCTGDKPTTQPEKTTEGVLNWAGRGKEEKKTALEPEGYPITFGLSTGVASLSKTYINPYFNIRVDLDQDWFIHSTSEIDALNDISTRGWEESRKQEYLDILATGVEVTDCYAESNSGLYVINIDIVHMSEEDRADDGMAFVNRYVGLSRDVFQKNELLLSTDRLGNTTVARKSWPCWFYSSEIAECESNSVCVFLQQNDYVLILKISCLGTNVIPDILAMSAPLE